MLPLNDLCKVKLETKRFKGTEKDTAESGILVDLPETMPHYGFWSYAFDDSLMNVDVLNSLYNYWKTKIGRKVYWTALSERGNIIEKDGERFAFVKLTSLIAEDEPGSSARNVHADGAGSFGLEN